MDLPAHIALMNVHFAPYTYGGATIVAEQVAQELVARHGCRVTAISTVAREDLVPYAVLRTRAGDIDSYLVNLPAGRSAAESYDNPRVTEIVTDIVGDLAPDLVHAHCLQELGVGALPILAGRGLPLVLSMHDFWWICERQFMIRANGTYCGQNPVRLEVCRGCVENMARTRLRREVLARAAAAADLVTFPSRFARDLTLASGIEARRAAVWENGVRGPGPGFFAAQAARRAADPRLVFGFIGGPGPVKGWPLIRGAFEGLGREDFAGVLVDASLHGTWWAGREPLDGLAGDWRIHPRFAQDGMDAFYAQIDVLLFPSQWKETFGLTVREAVARGIRVIQTDAGGASERPGADPAAMLKIGEGPAALRAQVLRALDDPQAHPEPIPMPGFADQADVFAELVAPISRF